MWVDVAFVSEKEDFLFKIIQIMNLALIGGVELRALLMQRDGTAQAVTMQTFQYRPAANSESCSEKTR